MMHSSTTTSPTITSKTEKLKTFLKVEFMVWLLYWNTLDCTCVLNEVPSPWQRYLKSCDD